MPVGIFVDISHYSTRQDMKRSLLEALKPGMIPSKEDHIGRYLFYEIERGTVISYIDGLERLSEQSLCDFLDSLVDLVKSIGGIWHLAVRDEVFNQRIRALFDNKCAQKKISPEIHEILLEGLTSKGMREMINNSPDLSERKKARLREKLANIPGEISSLPFFMDAIIKSYAEKEFDVLPSRRVLLRWVVDYQLDIQIPMYKEVLHSISLFILQKDSTHIISRDYHKYLGEPNSQKAFPELRDLDYKELKRILSELENKRFLVPFQKGEAFRFFHDMLLEHLAAEGLFKYEFWEGVKDKEHIVRFPWKESLKEFFLLTLDSEQFGLGKEILLKLPPFDASEVLAQVKKIKDFDPDREALKKDAIDNLRSRGKVIDSARVLENIGDEVEIRELILKKEIHPAAKEELLLRAVDYKCFTFLKIFLEDEDEETRFAALQIITEATFENFPLAIAQYVILLLEDYYGHVRDAAEGATRAIWRVNKVLLQHIISSILEDEDTLNLLVSSPIPGILHHLPTIKPRRLNVPRYRPFG